MITKHQSTVKTFHFAVSLLWPACGRGAGPYLCAVLQDDKEVVKEQGSVSSVRPSPLFLCCSPLFAPIISRSLVREESTVYCPDHFLAYSLKQIDGVNKAPPPPTHSLHDCRGGTCLWLCFLYECFWSSGRSPCFANITPTPLTTTPCETVSHPPLH